MFRSDFRREAWVGVFKILFYIGSKGQSARESWHKIRNNIQRESNIYAVFHFVFSFQRESNIYAVFYLFFSCFHDVNPVFSVVCTLLYINTI